MLKTITILTLCAAVSGCVAIPAAAVHSGSLKGVERAGALYIAETRPTVDATAGAACLTNAMTKVEVIKLGSKDSRVLTNEHRAAFTEVASRPEVANCLAALSATAA